MGRINTCKGPWKIWTKYQIKGKKEKKEKKKQPTVFPALRIVLYVVPVQQRHILLMYPGILMTVLHCQHHATTQHCLSRIRSIYSRNKQVWLLMNFTTTPNCTSVITSRQATGHQLLVYTARQMLVPNTVFVVEIQAGGKWRMWDCTAFA